MWTDIKLLNCSEVDVNYNHIPSFASLSNQISWFNTKVLYTIENCNYQRKNLDVKVPYHIDDLELVNYVMVNNNDRKWYFYFVLDKEYINERCTNLVLKIDVMQTYCFDYTFNECLIERMHYNRWNSDGSINRTYFKNEENIDSGEYVANGFIGMHSYKNKGCYIIVSSDMLGYDPNYTPTLDNNKPNGDISADIYLFLKGFEAYAYKPYQDSGGYWTIGYGVTELYQAEAYNDLLKECTERKASEYLYNMIYNNYFSAIIDDIKTYRKNPKQNEIDAFLSLAYNCGVGGCKESPMWEKYLNNESIEECSKGWTNYYITSNGVYVEGLVNRRIAEVNIFLNGIYDIKPIANYTDGTYITDNDGKGYVPSHLKYINGGE